MTPTIPIPTDNIYKFSCLFGLTLIVVAIFSFVSIYTSTLDRKVKHAEIVIPLESKSERTKAEDELLKLHKKLIEIAQDNQHAASIAISSVLCFGIVLSAVGGALWHKKIQVRDDRLANLQLEKLELELAGLRKENASAATKKQPAKGKLPVSRPS